MRSIVMRVSFLSWWCLCLVLQPAFASSVLVLGDSLSAAHNLPVEAGWVSLLEIQLRAQTPNTKVHNASISGETSAGGAERIGQLLREHRPDVLVVELGANDSLRGLSISQTRQNLERMLQAGRDSGAQVLLLGICQSITAGDIATACAEYMPSLRSSTPTLSCHTC